jgi:hypothetical protein
VIGTARQLAEQNKNWPSPTGKKEWTVVTALALKLEPRSKKG